ncbi:MAG TPA: hypothetical protein VGF99_06215, partial [Myxococcota bacterium]
VDGRCTADTFEATRDGDLLALATCTSFFGELEIKDEVSSLAPLANLVTIDGDLKIEPDVLANLEGLSALTTVSGELKIEGVASLEGATVLSSVGELVVEKSGVMTLSGLAALATVQRGIELKENDFLIDVALPAITSIGGRITVEDNPFLPICRVHQLADSVTPSPLVRDEGGNGIGTCD